MREKKASAAPFVSFNVFGILVKLFIRFGRKEEGGREGARRERRRKEGKQERGG